MPLLRNVAIVGGILALGGGAIFTHKIQNNFKQQEFYTKSVKLLLGYPPAVTILGEPIMLKNLDLGDVDKNYTDGLKSKLAIPLKGSKESGTLFSWSSRESTQDEWQVDKMNLQIQNRTWTFYLNPNKPEASKDNRLND